MVQPPLQVIQTDIPKKEIAKKPQMNELRQDINWQWGNTQHFLASKRLGTRPSAYFLRTQGAGGEHKHRKSMHSSFGKERVQIPKVRRKQKGKGDVN